MYNTLISGVARISCLQTVDNPLKIQGSPCYLAASSCLGVPSASFNHLVVANPWQERQTERSAKKFGTSHATKLTGQQGRFRRSPSRCSMRVREFGGIAEKMPVSSHALRAHRASIHAAELKR